MPVTLHLPAILARLAGEGTVSADGGTVGEIISDVSSRYPALAPRLRDGSGAPYPFVTFYLNEDDIRLLGEFQAPVRDGDTITIVPAIAGG
jgi:molybdopterin converting factor small subunit